MSVPVCAHNLYQWFDHICEYFQNAFLWHIHICHLFHLHIVPVDHNLDDSVPDLREQG